MSRKLKIKTGFAITSTNSLSLEDAREALFNALLARRYRQPFQLRIDDKLDSHQQTEVLTAEEPKAIKELRWLGLDWDEGPGVGGDHSPYFRSQRSAIYAAFYVKLIDMGLAFPCFCTEKELAVVREAQLEAGIEPHYAGGCHRLNREGRQKKVDLGLSAVLRFKAEAGRECHFEDLILGPQECKADEVGAFVIRSHDGVPDRLFTTAIDDALGGITHKFRSFQKMDELPAQIMLLDSLGLPHPAYGHLPALLPDEGARGSDHDLTGVTLAMLREGGYQPLAILNWLARLGHSYDSAEVLGLDELSTGFHLSKLAHEPVFFDRRELNGWQSRAEVLF